MGAQLRVVLDQLVHVVDPDQAAAASALATGLVATAPSGCAVEAIVPAGAQVDIAGISDVRVLPLGRRELATSWQLGIAPAVGGGLIHAPSLMAPLVRHDRLHDGDQTAVTLWDLHAWEAPETLSRTRVAWQRAMLRRAAKHADAVVVPSHAVADRLSGIVSLGDRVRVIAGAPPEGFEVPADAGARRAALGIPGRYVVIVGALASMEEGFRAAAAADRDVVILDAPEGSEPRHAERAASVGLAEQRVHVRGLLAAEDRAAVLAGAEALVAPSGLAAWPWRAVEAMALSVPVVAVDSGVHRDVIAEGGSLVPSAELPDAVMSAVHDSSARLRVLAGDRSRAFSWASSAERVWALHADL